MTSGGFARSFSHSFPYDSYSLEKVSPFPFSLILNFATQGQSLNVNLFSTFVSTSALVDKTRSQFGSQNEPSSHGFLTLTDPHLPSVPLTTSHRETSRILGTTKTDVGCFHTPSTYPHYTHPYPTPHSSPLIENHLRQIETKCHLRQMEDTYSIIYLRKPKLSNNKNETEINILRPHSLLTLSTDPHLPYVSLISPHRESSRRMLETKRI